MDDYLFGLIPSCYLLSIIPRLLERSSKAGINKYDPIICRHAKALAVSARPAILCVQVDMEVYLLVFLGPGMEPGIRYPSDLRYLGTPVLPGATVS